MFLPAVLYYPVLSENKAACTFIRGTIPMTDQQAELETLQAQVKSAAVKLFEGDKQMAESWLSSPLPIIDNETPYTYMDSPERAKQLLGIINRFEHGVWT